eukprot:IDg10686t1
MRLPLWLWDAVDLQQPPSYAPLFDAALNGDSHSIFTGFDDPPRLSPAQPAHISPSCYYYAIAG